MSCINCKYSDMIVQNGLYFKCENPKHKFYIGNEDIASISKCRDYNEDVECDKQLKESCGFTTEI